MRTALTYFVVYRFAVYWLLYMAAVLHGMVTIV